MYKNSVYKTLALITQIGISIMVPIFLMLIIGIIIKDRFNTNLLIWFIIIGVIVGIRNTIILISNFLKDDRMTNKNDESELTKKHKKYIENKYYKKNNK